MSDYFESLSVDESTNIVYDQSNCILQSDPILIHFHDIPILILRAIPTYVNIDNLTNNINNHNENDSSSDYHHLLQYEYDIIYLSQVHCHNHKICEDTIYTIKCCSRMEVNSNSLPTVSSESSLLSHHQLLFKNYDHISAIGIEVFLRYSGQKDSNHVSKVEFQAKDIIQLLMIHCLNSVLTVNECLVIELNGKELVCRVSKVSIDTRNIIEASADEHEDTKKLSAAEASLDDPFRGRVTVNTQFYVQTSNHDSVYIHGGKLLPEGSLPDDIIHVTTIDNEWFPVRRLLLAPCIHLTKYVHHNKGIYKNKSKHSEVDEQEIIRQSPDAPKSGIHCSVNIDCCTFDRVLLFIMSQLYPNQYKFVLELSETNALSHAAEELGLISLSELCQSQLSSFESRVRRDKYIRFSEIEQRNQNNELLIIIDGMVFDITRWIDFHPGGASIIPSQALNIDCTCFFEMYHVSSASFLYLKSFYIGELHPATQLKKSELKPSEGFLQSLRLYTEKWRVTIEEKVGEQIHKSL